MSTKQIEFDNLVIYINFNYNLKTVKSIFTEFINKYSINLNEVNIAYSIPNRIELQKYALTTRIQYLDWLEGLGSSRLNISKDIMSSKDDLIKLFNYAVNTKSLCVFIGELTSELMVEFTELKRARTPIIHLLPDKIIEEIWVGVPDKDINSSESNMS